MEEVYRGTWVIAYREVLRFTQERSRLVSSFAMPVLFLVVFGAGFSRIVAPLPGDVDFIQFMYPGIITMTVLMNSLFSGLSVVWDREFGFLKEVLVAPLSRSGIMLGKAVGGSAIALMQGLGMLVLAPFLGVSLSVPLVLKLVPLLVLISLSLSGLGLLIAARMRSQRGFQMLIQVLIFPLMFLSGIFFPVGDVPLWIEVIAKLNPVTYGVDAVRRTLLGDEFVAAAAALGDAGGIVGVTVFGHTTGVVEDAAIVGLFALVFLSAATWSFSRVE